MLVLKAWRKNIARALRRCNEISSERRKKVNDLGSRCQPWDSEFLRPIDFRISALAQRIQDHYAINCFSSNARDSVLRKYGHVGLTQKRHVLHANCKSNSLFIHYFLVGSNSDRVYKRFGCFLQLKSYLNSWWKNSARCEGSSGHCVWGALVISV
jgi:hypothetical protein